MTAKDCLKILREVKDVAFATVDGEGRPQVRIIDVMLVEEEKLYFCTARGKDFYRQLENDGYVAVTGMNREFQMVRLNGKAERLSDAKGWIDRIFEENPVMKEVYPGDRRYILEPFCIADGQMEFFDLGKSPIFRECFTIGRAECKRKGFFITKACTGCDTCRSGCPQQCIEIDAKICEAEGVTDAPYTIRQEHCLHCGWCYENCPANAIETLSPAKTLGECSG